MALVAAADYHIELKAQRTATDVALPVDTASLFAGDTLNGTLTIGWVTAIAADLLAPPNGQKQVALVVTNTLAAPMFLAQDDVDQYQVIPAASRRTIYALINQAVQVRK